MFKNKITDTPLTTIEAESFFPNITGVSFDFDVTFIATLRALLYSRVQNSDVIEVYFSTSTYTTHDLKSNAVAALLNSITHAGYRDKYAIDADTSGIIQVHNCAGDSSTDCMNLIEHQFDKYYRGWSRLDKVTDFFRRTFRVLCYIHPETKCVFLFVDNLNIQKLHYLQCAIFAFLPWYFDPKQGVTEEEMELINSLREKKSDKYEMCIAEFASRFDFRTTRIKDMLSGFETRYERIRCEELETEIKECIDRINSLNAQIGNFLKSKAEWERQLLGLETKIQQSENAGEDSEIMGYFLCNNNLVLESVDDTSMQFTVKGYVDFFDEDIAKSVIDNRRSYVYRPNGRACNNYIPEEDMKRLMYALFIDQTLRMKFCASYRLELNGNVVAQTHHDYGYECMDCTPNPHIDKYACMGDYQRVINELLRKHDCIGAIEQCSASCRSLNFGDSIVMREFMNRLYGTGNCDSVNIRCIELPDGKVVAPKEAIIWLKGQEANTNE